MYKAILVVEICKITLYFVRHLITLFDTSIHILDVSSNNRQYGKIRIIIDMSHTFDFNRGSNSDV